MSGVMAGELEGFAGAANALAALLRPYPWYHRTSMSLTRADGESVHYLTVWAECRFGDRPEIPDNFGGYKVRVNQVSREAPCPLGSVREGFHEQA